MTRTRRRRPPLAALVASALVLLLAGVGWLLVRARTARSELLAARGDLATAQRALLDQRGPYARLALRAASLHTARAVQVTSDPIWRVASDIPLVGRSVGVVRAVSREADLLAGRLLPNAVTLADRVDPRRLRHPDGTLDVAAVRNTQPALDALADRIHTLRVTTGQLSQFGLVPPVARALGQFAHQVGQLDSATAAARQAVDLLPPLLGVDRPRRYFVMVQQTSESRGTGGLVGGFAILEANAGRLSVSAEGTDANLVNGPVPVPPGVPSDYAALYDPSGAFDIWQNVNLSPDLPVVARVVAARWQQQSGQHVDGVIAVDALALADILRGSGPVDVGGGQLLDPSALPDFLAVGQYQGIPANSDLHRLRKDRLTAIARLATKRLTSGGGGSVSLARGLVDAIRTGHLRMASDDPALHDRLHSTGVDGALPTGRSPLADLVVYNSSGGKLDYFLDRSISYTAGGCARGRRRTTIAVTLRNSAPPTGLPPYLTILVQDGPALQSSDGLDTVSVFGTRGARLRSATLDGRPLGPTATGPDAPTLFTYAQSGLPVWYTLLPLPRGRARRLVLSVDEPALAGSPVVPEQPLARPLRRYVDVPACG